MLCDVIFPWFPPRPAVTMQSDSESKMMASHHPNQPSSGSQKVPTLSGSPGRQQQRQQPGAAPLCLGRGLSDRQSSLTRILGIPSRCVWNVIWQHIIRGWNATRLDKCQLTHKRKVDQNVWSIRMYSGSECTVDQNVHSDRLQQVKLLFLKNKQCLDNGLSWRHKGHVDGAIKHLSLEEVKTAFLKED